ncbi:hypothetical protein COBT_002056 [Conglomerata obtusa]
MHDNQKIDEEIRKFLSINTTPNKIVETPTKNYKQDKDKYNELLYTLKELLHVYESIKNGFASEAKVDTKLINNNLTNLIKAIIEERKSKDKEFNEICEDRDELKRKLEYFNLELKKKEDTVKYDKMKKEEMNRMFKDQKERLIEYKSKFESQKKDSDGMKVHNKELEIMCDKIKEKNEWLEGQMNVFGIYLKEKEAEIENLKLNNDKQNKIADEIKNKCNNLKLDNEKLKNLVIDKENIISVLNSEMNKLIQKEDRYEAETKDAKEKSSYYERLYRSASKQNEYLNNELAKMINVKNVGLLQEKDFIAIKDSTSIKDSTDYNMQIDNNSFKNNEKNDNVAQKYKKKLKKLTKIFDNKNEENLKLRREIEKGNQKIFDLANEIKVTRNENSGTLANHKNLNEKLFERIEKLIANNKELQEMVFKLKNQNMEKKDEKIQKPNQIITENEYKPYLIQDTNDIYKHFDLNKHFENEQDSFKSIIEFNQHFITSKFESPMKQDENDYIEEMKQVRKLIENEEIENPFLDKKQIDEPVKNNYISNNQDSNYINIKHDYFNNDRDIFLNNKIQENRVKQISDVQKEKESNDSTTSSLKNMINRTEKLKNRFDDLETKLKNIKIDNFHVNDIKKENKNQTCYLFSDGIDLENDPDVI